MKKLFKEFKEFINKGNALALAIGVIIGGAFTSIVTAINKSVISPLIGAICGDSDLSGSLITVLKYQVDVNGNFVIDPDTGEKVIANAIYWGTFLQAVIDFLLTAIILFVIFKIASAVTKAAKKAVEKIEMEKNAKNQEVVEAEVEIVKEPTFEEKQLEILNSICNKLDGLNKNETK